MLQGKLHMRRWLVGSIGVISLAGAMVSVAAGSGSAALATSHKAVVQRARPDGSTRGGTRDAATSTQYPVTAMSQQFAYNTRFFCPPGTGNAPCDGNAAAGDYGTIDRVSGGFSNGGSGNYAPATKALVGSSMAVTSGTGDGNLGVGCPGTTSTSNPGEACTGPYALFGTGAAAGAENVFPSKGFTVTDDLYLSPTTAPVAGSLVDDDVEINKSSGTYGIDNIITACAESTGASTMGFVINFGHNSAGSCSGTPVITTDGWYRFVFVFSNTDGYAYLTESVLSDPGATGTPTVVASNSPQPVGGTASATAISNWGGPGYFWLPTEDMSGLPLANFALQLGEKVNGNTP
jgi:hypothetical protein